MLIKQHRFLATAWKTPQDVDESLQQRLRETYTAELWLLHAALPERLRPFVQDCLSRLDDVLSLPVVLLHGDLGPFNVMVDAESCHLTGVIDWAEAENGPFGLDLYRVEEFSGKLHLADGWSRYADYYELQQVFWTTFAHEVGGLTNQQIQAIEAARILGLLLDKGFAYQEEKGPRTRPIEDDDIGRYKLLSLDGFLIHDGTKFGRIADYVL